MYSSEEDEVVHNDAGDAESKSKTPAEGEAKAKVGAKAVEAKDAGDARDRAAMEARMEEHRLEQDAREANLRAQPLEVGQFDHPSARINWAMLQSFIDGAEHGTLHVTSIWRGNLVPALDHTHTYRQTMELSIPIPFELRRDDTSGELWIRVAQYITERAGLGEARNDNAWTAYGDNQRWARLYGINTEPGRDEELLAPAVVVYHEEKGDKEDGSAEYQSPLAVQNQPSPTKSPRAGGSDKITTDISDALKGTISLNVSLGTPVMTVSAAEMARLPNKRWEKVFGDAKGESTRKSYLHWEGVLGEIDSAVDPADHSVMLKVYSDILPTLKPIDGGIWWPIELLKLHAPRAQEAKAKEAEKAAAAREVAAAAEKKKKAREEKKAKKQKEKEDRRARRKLKREAEDAGFYGHDAIEIQMRPIAPLLQYQASIALMETPPK